MFLGAPLQVWGFTTRSGATTSADEGGFPHKNDTLPGGATPAEAGGSCPRTTLTAVGGSSPTHADKGGKYTRQGAGGLVDGGIKPHFNADSPTPEGKKIVRWSEKLNVREFSDKEDDILELTPEIGDAGGEGAINRGRPGTPPYPGSVRKQDWGKAYLDCPAWREVFSATQDPHGKWPGVFSSRVVGC